MKKMNRPSRRTKLNEDIKQYTSHDGKIFAREPFEVHTQYTAYHRQFNWS